MNKRKLGIFLIIAVVIIAIVFSVVLQNRSQENGEQVAKERTVTINYNPDNYASAVFQIAKEKGLFEKYLPENVKV